MLGRIKRQGCNPKLAFIMTSTECIRSWMNDYPEVYDRIVEITKNAIAFQCHPDKLNLAVNHSLTYTFEWVFMSMLKGIPGNAMEEFFNLGSQGLRDRLAAEKDSFDKIVGELTGVKPKNIHTLFTWITEHSALHDHAEKFCDDTTREGVDAMIRRRSEGFLQNHITNRVFPEANMYVDGVAVNDNFEAIRESSATISALLSVTEKGVDLINNAAIRKELATINRESQCAKDYVIPQDQVLCEGYERAMLEKFASVIKEMKKKTYQRDEVISCDRARLS